MTEFILLYTEILIYRHELLINYTRLKVPMIRIVETISTGGLRVLL